MCMITSNPAIHILIFIVSIINIITFILFIIDVYIAMMISPNVNMIIIISIITIIITKYS